MQKFTNYKYSIYIRRDAQIRTINKSGDLTNATQPERTNKTNKKKPQRTTNAKKQNKNAIICRKHNHPSRISRELIEN